MGVITASAFDQVARNGPNALSSIMIQQIQHAAATKQILTVPQFRAWLSARAFMFDKHGNTELASALIHFQNYREPRTDVKMAKGAKRRSRVCPLEQAASDAKLGSLLFMDEESRLVVIGALGRIIPLQSPRLCLGRVFTAGDAIAEAKEAHSRAREALARAEEAV